MKTPKNRNRGRYSNDYLFSKMMLNMLWFVCVYFMNTAFIEATASRVVTVESDNNIYPGSSSSSNNDNRTNDKDNKIQFIERQSDLLIIIPTTQSALEHDGLEGKYSHIVDTWIKDMSSNLKWDVLFFVDGCSTMTIQPIPNSAGNVLILFRFFVNETNKKTKTWRV